MIPDMSQTLYDINQNFVQFGDSLIELNTKTDKLCVSVKNLAIATDKMQKDIKYLKNDADLRCTTPNSFSKVSIGNSIFRSLAVIIFVALAILISMFYFPTYTQTMTIGGLMTCIIPLCSIAEDTRIYFSK